MCHKISSVLVIATLCVAIVPAAPTRSSESPQPDAPHTSVRDPAAPISRYVIGPYIENQFRQYVAAPIREAVRLLPHARLERELPQIQRQAYQVVAAQAREHRYEPLDLAPNIDAAGHQGRTAPSSSALATCTVTTAADSGPGSLRQCLLDATLGTTIDFAPLTFPPTAPATITLSSPLPYIFADSVNIDGSNAGVVLDGGGLSAGNGLVVFGADSVTVRGLQVLNFPDSGIVVIFGASNVNIGGDQSIGTAPLGQGNLISGNGNSGVWMQDAGTTNNQVLGNYIGVDITGTAPRGNGFGVGMGFGATNNVVGSDAAGKGNLISGNSASGVQIQNSGTTGNRVLGNLIGTDAEGTNPLGNGYGVAIGFGATDNEIGGHTAGARNLISGNADWGITIQGNGTNGNQVLGNYIGTDAAGAAALGNDVGVFILLGAQSNIVGGDTADARNLISGNTGSGVKIQENGTNDNQVLGNYIGTDAAGTAPLGNPYGVVIHFGAKDNIVGGDTAGARNIISGNGTGVWIQNDNTTGNQVLGNHIGTTVNGTTALGNTLMGVAIRWGASSNVIGGDTSGSRNVISGNNGAGIQIQDDATTGNLVLGNYIGPDINGVVALGSQALGILVSGGAADNIIGGDTSGARNVISGNTDAGIQIQTAGTTGNQVLGNYVGINAAGTGPLGNNRGVIVVICQDNVIGGNTAGARNVISGNHSDGIVIQGDETTVLGNYIGTDASGTVALGNGSNGVRIGYGVSNNLIGGDTAGARNLISGNASAGVGIEQDGTTANRVSGNYIGTDLNGEAALGNLWGVVIAFGATDNFVGGDAAGAGNVISANTGPGVQIQDYRTTGNHVLGNYIGTDASGLAPLGNAYGVFIYADARNNVVGGTTPGARNVISGNNDLGVGIHSGATGNQVLGNYIGTDATGLAPLGNPHGVIIEASARQNYVGDGTAGARNVVSGNTKAGIVINLDGTTDNQVLGNNIGTDETGTRPLGNSWDGVAIIYGASENLVGGNSDGAGNLISGNSGSGVWLGNDRTTRNELIGNDILTNTVHGVHLAMGANTNTVGVSNTIAYNGSAGVAVDGAATLGNTVTRNRIFQNSDLPIKFINTPIPIAAPVLSDTLCVDNAIMPISGQACIGCQVEIYGNPVQEPGGTLFLAETTADATGDFTATVTCSSTYPHLSGTTTNLDGTTSEFFPGSTTVYLPLITLQTASGEHERFSFPTSTFLQNGGVR